MELRLGVPTFHHSLDPAQPELFMVRDTCLHAGLRTCLHACLSARAASSSVWCASHRAQLQPTYRSTYSSVASPAALQVLSAIADSVARRPSPTAWPVGHRRQRETVQCLVHSQTRVDGMYLRNMSVRPDLPAARLKAQWPRNRV